MQSYFVNVGSVGAVANVQTPLPITRGKIFRRFALRLVLTGMTFGGGANNTAATCLNGDEWNIISRLELKYGNDIIFACSGAQLWQDNYTNGKYRPQVTQTLGDGSTATVNFDSVLFIDFESEDMQDSKASMLDTSRLDLAEVTLNITWAPAHTSVNSNAATTMSATNTILYVSGDEYIPTGTPNGIYHPQLCPFGYGAPFFTPILTSHQIDFGQAVAGDQPFKLPSNRLLKSVVIETLNTAGTTQTTGLITGFKLVKDDRTLRDLNEVPTRELAYRECKLPNGYERALNSGTGGVGRLMQATKFDQRALYLMNFRGDGWFGNLESLYGVDKFELRPTTSAACRVNALVRGYLDPRRRAA